MEDRRDTFRILVARTDWGKKNLGDRVVDVKIILKCIFKKCDWEVWTGILWLKLGTVGGCL
jgi:hypothetical protein